MNILFLEQASREFLDAAVYYDRRQPGLGRRFENEVDRALRWLAVHPEACALRRGIYRRLNLHIFPYYIPYNVRSSDLWIVDVAHARRRPEYWIKRTEQIDR